MNRRPANILRLTALLCISIAGCEKSATVPTATSSSTESSAITEAGADFPRDFVDALDRKVRIERRPERIVCLAPAVTEILFAIGAGPNVTANTTQCTYPPEVKDLPHVGGFMPKTINLEAIIAQKPDVVFATGRLQKETIEALARLGTTVLAADANSIDETTEMILTIARATGRDAAGEKVVAELLARTAAVKAFVESRQEPKPKVLYVVGADPLFVAGKPSLLGAMVEAAGGVNVFGDVEQFYPRVGDEEVLKRAPEVILAPRLHGGDDLKNALLKRPGWSSLPAVKAGRIVFIDEDIVSRPGPRLADGLEAIQQALYGTTPAATSE